MKWKALHMPKGIVKEKGDSKYGKFVIEPFERGWGITVGNALRRVLLSSLQGAAVVSGQARRRVSMNFPPSKG